MTTNAEGDGTEWRTAVPSLLRYSSGEVAGTWRIAAPAMMKPIGMNRISGIGHENHVARRGDGLRQIGEAFLRTERRDHFAVGIERHTEAALVIGRHAPAAGP